MKPSTVDTGSSRPLRTDSSKLQRRLLLETVAGAEVDNSFLGSRFFFLGDPHSLSVGLCGSNNARLMSLGVARPESKSNLIPPRLKGAGDDVRGRPVLLWNTIEAAESKDFRNAFFLLADGTPSSSSIDILRLLQTSSRFSSETDQSSLKPSKEKSNGCKVGLGALVSNLLASE